jgi:3-oxoacyl-[acyl-carrier protein] reductase
MMRQKGGVILNATSTTVLNGNTGQTNYIPTKSRGIGIAKVSTRELGRYNIRVNAVAPGFTETEILHTPRAPILERMRAASASREKSPMSISCSRPMKPASSRAPCCG